MFFLSDQVPATIKVLFLAFHQSIQRKDRNEFLKRLLQESGPEMNASVIDSNRKLTEKFIHSHQENGKVSRLTLYFLSFFLLSQLAFSSSILLWRRRQNKWMFVRPTQRRRRRRPKKARSLFVCSAAAVAADSITDAIQKQAEEIVRLASVGKKEEEEEEERRGGQKLCTVWAYKLVGRPACWAFVMHDYIYAVYGLNSKSDL
jgi:hypothetical protein